MSSRGDVLMLFNVFNIGYKTCFSVFLILTLMVFFTIMTLTDPRTAARKGVVTEGVVRGGEFGRPPFTMSHGS